MNSYAANYDSMTDEAAGKLLKELDGARRRTADLVKKYVKKTRQSVAGDEGAALRADREQTEYRPEPAGVARPSRSRSNRKEQRMLANIRLQLFAASVARCAARRLRHQRSRNSCGLRPHRGFRQVPHLWLPERGRHGRHRSSSPSACKQCSPRLRAKWKSRGYTRAENPDLVINFKGKLEEKTDIESTPAPYYGPGWGYGGWLRLTLRRLRTWAARKSLRAATKWARSSWTSSTARSGRRYSRAASKTS